MPACYQNFRYLDINACLSRVAQNRPSSAQALGCVSPQGFTNSETKRINDHGLIQFCLLNSALFNFDDAFLPSTNRIRNLCTDQLGKCRERSKLIDALAEALLNYDRHSAQEDIAEPHLRWNQTQKEFHHVRHVLFTFLRLRDKKDFPVHPRLRHLRKSAITKACETIATVIDTLRPKDYKAICQDEFQLLKTWGSFTTYSPETRTFYAPATRNPDLLRHMHTAFKDHGPERNYTQDAIFRAIATIYIAFGLEEDNGLPTVAGRLLKRFQRSSHPRPDDNEE
jgi:hypothetical protein